MSDVKPVSSSSRKRVLLVVRWPVGGINTYLRYVYRDPQFANYQLVMLVPELEDVEAMREELAGERVEIRSVPAADFFKAAWREALRGRYDLIHAHGVSSGLIAALPARLRRIRYMVTLHDIFLAKQFIGIKGKLRLMIIARLLGLADVVQAVSEGAARNIIEFLPPVAKHADKKLSVILHGIDVPRFQTDQVRDLRAELDLPADTFLVGFMGRFMSPKGFTFLVQAFERLMQKPEYKGRLKLVAVGSGGFEREEKSDVEARGLQDDILFLPQTDQVPQTLKGMDLVVMPSLWEACGLLAMEALVAGVPVVVSDCYGMTEVLKDTPAKMVRPGNVDDVVAMVSEHVADNRRAEFEAYAPQAAQRYSIGRVIRELSALYERLTAG